ncbi:uncharacterized protein LOC143846530 isoform X1 [Tasmannia lanceolata]|uniref:uncharacterized protein LOC143846530 isoform X1 n=1 Tax=Tasmannia lanceolata TaxID=3420 RepID=UPI004063A70F
MAKNKGKKKKNGAVSMEILAEAHADLPQDTAMDTSELTTSNPALGVVKSRKIKKGMPMKRSKNLRKLKSIEKAVCKSDMLEVKISKNKSKMLRIQSAKSLYD